jgi:tRNA threonylcarbamoyladenosine biosynthesis protein TsaE
MKKVLRSSSSRETAKFGRDFARRMLASQSGSKAGSKANSATNKRALVIALSGDLGAGKTTFIQGFLKGLGVKKRSPSPTFIIFRRHAIPKKRSQLSVYHMDAYRLKNAKTLGALDFKKILANPENILLIEWGEKIKKALPKETIWLTFSHGQKENQRKIEVEN